ncbi:MAG: enoyl-CoA hydratase [Burkholderiaceae bacterium]
MLETPHSLTVIDERGVGTLTIVNARPLNLLSSPVILDLTEALRRLAGDPALRVLVLRGSGDKAFIGGADINEMAALDPPGAEQFISRLRGLCDAVRDMPMPTIARLAGYTLGGGLEVALACDLRIADRNARFGMPEVKVGIPSVIHAAMMPRLIGQARTSWMLLTGELIDAATAEQWGLVHPLAAIGQLDAIVAETAGALAELGPAALRQQKALIRHWEDTTLDDAIDATVAQFGRAFTTGEPQRFMAAFQRGKSR